MQNNFYKLWLLLSLISLFHSAPSYSKSNKNIIPQYGNKRFNEWTWLTAHNSHLNWHDSSVIGMASNQEMSIEIQLKNGVRGFMFDIDLKTCSSVEIWFSSCQCEGICLCHGSCAAQVGNSIKDGFAVKKLDYALKKLVNFLVKNPNEIVTLFLEDYVTDTRKLQAVFTKVRNLNNLVFDPCSAQWNVVENGWPLLMDMIKANKRFLIVDSSNIHARQQPGIIRPRDFFIENHWDWTHDTYQWDVNKIPKETLFRFASYAYENKTSVSMEMSRCVSVFKTERGIPTWSDNSTLNLDLKENIHELKNGDKLFLFNHFYGVLAKSSSVNANTLRVMNSKDFVMTRFKEKCSRASGFVKPNYIALDFITESVYKDLIEPLNN